MYTLRADQLVFCKFARMPALLPQTSGIGPEKLKWGKYSLTYRKRLLEGSRALTTFLAEVVTKGKSKRVDDVLEHFVKSMHSSPERSSFRIAKHAVLTVQI